MDTHPVRGAQPRGRGRRARVKNPEGSEGFWTRTPCVGRSPEGAGGAPESKTPRARRGFGHAPRAWGAAPRARAARPSQKLESEGLQVWRTKGRKVEEELGRGLGLVPSARIGGGCGGGVRGEFQVGSFKFQGGGAWRVPCSWQATDSPTCPPKPWRRRKHRLTVRRRRKRLSMTERAGFQASGSIRKRMRVLVTEITQPSVSSTAAA